MYQAEPLMTVDCNWQTALICVTDTLENAGLQVLRSFDLQVASPANTTCTCLHHRSGQCTCQIVVILVYGQAGQFMTIVIHGYEEQTFFSLVDSTQQPSNVELGAVIRRELLTSSGHLQGETSAMRQELIQNSSLEQTPQKRGCSGL